MKLRNKNTGEIGYLLAGKTSHNYFVTNDEWDRCGVYDSLAELNEEWEDAPEEPRGIQCIYYVNHFDAAKLDGVIVGFETKEEAEKAVEKLKAWKRLKDDGLEIRKYELNGGTDRNGCFTGDICLTLDISKPVYEDILQLLFGGEE